MEFVIFLGLRLLIFLLPSKHDKKLLKSLIKLESEVKNLEIVNKEELIYDLENIKIKTLQFIKEKLDNTSKL
jgi:hypothetical protein